MLCIMAFIAILNRDLFFLCIFYATVILNIQIIAPDDIVHHTRTTSMISVRLSAKIMHICRNLAGIFLLDTANFLNLLMSISAMLILLSNDAHQNPGLKYNISDYSDCIKKISADHSNDTKYVHVNFNSMSRKPEFFRKTMSDLHDRKTIIGISETWLKSTDNTDTWAYDKEHLQLFSGRIDQHRILRRRAEVSQCMFLAHSIQSPDKT